MKIEANKVMEGMIIIINSYGQKMKVKSVVFGERKNGNPTTIITGDSLKHIHKTKSMPKALICHERKNESIVYGFNTKIKVIP